jgi:hypothetical protein
VAAQVGVDFHHFAGATGEFYFPENMGSGVALLDYDGDGDLDLFLVQGDVLDPRQQRSNSLAPLPPGWKPGCRLYRNDLALGGLPRFVDVTEQAGIHVEGFGMGAAVGDYDNDGYPDLYVTRFGHNVLLHNSGRGSFTDATREAGVDDSRWSSSAAFVDYDRDGLLDLFVANYVDFSIARHKPCYAATGERDYCSPKNYHGLPARLLHNLGGGRFRDVSLAAGIGSTSGPGLGVVGVELEAGGPISFFVANDQAANYLWGQRSDGRFREEALPAGVAFDAEGRARANMGIAQGDYDNDGEEDLFVTHLAREGSVLYRNEGQGVFDDVTVAAGLHGPTVPFTGFGCDWLDYDNDGWLDLFIANGAITREEGQRGRPYPYEQTNQLFHNEGAGKGFRETSAEAGPALALPGVGRGVAIGDLNNDGAVDVVVANNNGPARVLLNETPARGHWLLVRLHGAGANRMGLGARVAVLRRGQKAVWRCCHTDGSYLSASDARVHFGLGSEPELEAVVVAWPDGKRERWSGVRADKILDLWQGRGQPEGTGGPALNAQRR